MLLSQQKKNPLNQKLLEKAEEKQISKEDQLKKEEEEKKKKEEIENSASQLDTNIPQEYIWIQSIS